MYTGQTGQNLPILSPYSHMDQEPHINLNESGMIYQDENRILNTQRVEKMKNYQEQLMQDVQAQPNYREYEVDLPEVEE